MFLQAEILPSLEDQVIANIPYSGECLIQGNSKVWVGVSRAEGSKCERCWNYSLLVGSFSDHPTLCSRCHNVVGDQLPREVVAVSWHPQTNKNIISLIISDTSILFQDRVRVGKRQKETQNQSWTPNTRSNSVVRGRPRILGFGRLCDAASVSTDTDERTSC